MYNKKSTWTITGLRKLFKEFRGQLETGQTSAIASALLCGKALCVCCWQHKKKSGLLSLRSDTLNEHINHPQHKAHMARLATVGIQLDMFEAGGAQLDSREAQLATLVGVPMGAAGIPPSSLPSVMSKEVLTVVGSLDSGIPSKRTILREENLDGTGGGTLVQAVKLVKEEIRRMVQREGVRMSIFADGGSGGRLADGRKVIVITCLPSGSEDPLLLKVQVLDAHETGVVQAQIIKDVAAEYGINPSSIKYLCADNAAVNSKTVDLLREEAAWAHLEYVRCLPHCLNLAMVAFVKPFDDRFKLSGLLGRLRGFLTAGGTASRKLMLIEYGLKLSGFDFVKTRWFSMVEALVYLAEEQTDKELDSARKRLQELSIKGDKSAEEALAEEDNKLLHYVAVAGMVEAIAESSLRSVTRETSEAIDGEGDLTKTRKLLLDNLADLNVFATCLLLKEIFGGYGNEGVSAKTVFILSQGGAAQGYEARLAARETGAVPSALSAAKGLLASLQKLGVEDGEGEGGGGGAGAGAGGGAGGGGGGAAPPDAPRRGPRGAWALRALAAPAPPPLVLQPSQSAKRALGSVRDLLVKRREELIGNARVDNDSLTGAGDFSEAQVPVFREKFNGLIDQTMKNMQTVLMQAVASVREAEGTKKLAACIKDLEGALVFDVNQRPPPLPRLANGNVDESAFWAQLGLKDEPSFSEATALEIAWLAHEEEWRERQSREAGTALAKFMNIEVTKYWEFLLDNEDTAPLARIALFRWERPTAAVSCERIFSYLTKMDAADRNKMGAKTMSNVLFLRGNRSILNRLLERQAARIILVERGSKKAAERAKKQRLDATKAKVRAAAEAAAAMAAEHASSASAESGSGDGGSCGEEMGEDGGSEEEGEEEEAKGGGGGGDGEEEEEEEEGGEGGGGGGGGGGSGGGGLRKARKHAAAAAATAAAVASRKRRRSAKGADEAQVPRITLRPFAERDHATGKASWGYILDSDEDSQVSRGRF